jgi:hypothetical protein
MPCIVANSTRTIRAPCDAAGDSPEPGVIGPAIAASGGSDAAITASRHAPRGARRLR